MGSRIQPSVDRIFLNHRSFTRMQFDFANQGQCIGHAKTSRVVNETNDPNQEIHGGDNKGKGQGAILRCDI